MDALAVIGAYVLGAVPFSQMVSMRVVGADLRTVGTGTVSGTGPNFPPTPSPIAEAVTMQERCEKGPAGIQLRRVWAQRISVAACRKMSSSISGVSLPVNVFCWLGWKQPIRVTSPCGV
jgi:hypothetical protein